MGMDSGSVDRHEVAAAGNPTPSPLWEYHLAGKAVVGRRVLLGLDTHLPAGEHMRLTISALLTVVLAACATLPRSPGPQYSVISRYDEAYGGTLIAMHNNFLPSGAGEPNLAVGAARIQLAPPDSAHHLWIVDYHGDEWALIGDDHPLIFLVDGQPFRFESMGPAQREMGQAGNVAERGVYLASARDIRRVATGNDVRVQIGGRTRTIDRVFGAENVRRLREFVAHHVR